MPWWSNRITWYRVRSKALYQSYHPLCSWFFPYAFVFISLALLPCFASLLILSPVFRAIYPTWPAPYLHKMPRLLVVGVRVGIGTLISSLPWLFQAPKGGYSYDWGGVLCLTHASRTLRDFSKWEESTGILQKKYKPFRFESQTIRSS